MLKVGQEVWVSGRVVYFPADDPFGAVALVGLRGLTDSILRWHLETFGEGR